MRRYLLFILVFAPAALRAQDITGIWQGHFRGNVTSARSSIFDDRYRFEVQIAQRDKAFEGVTYSYLSTVFYGKAAATGTVNPRTSKVLLQEGKILEFRNAFGDICTMTCFLQYTKSGDDEFLEGTYVSMNTRDSSNCGRGTIFLHKVLTSDFYTEPFVAKRQEEIAETKKKNAITAAPIHKSTAAPERKPSTATSGSPKTGAVAKHDTLTSKPRVRTTEPPVHPMTRASVSRETMKQPGNDSAGTAGIGRKFPTITPRVILERENPVIKTLTIHTNEITLNIYDDGEIDGDSVSVYVDNKQVLSHAMLTDRPLVVTIRLDDTNNYHEVVMVAENEGTIPPNTSLMIVKAGDKEYKVNITTTEQKNAVIKFLYEK
jgi:hypothetical protein